MWKRGQWTCSVHRPRRDFGSKRRNNTFRCFKENIVFFSLCVTKHLPFFYFKRFPNGVGYVYVVVSLQLLAYFSLIQLKKKKVGSTCRKEEQRKCPGNERPLCIVHQRAHSAMADGYAVDVAGQDRCSMSARSVTVGVELLLDDGLSVSHSVTVSVMTCRIVNFFPLSRALLIMTPHEGKVPQRCGLYGVEAVAFLPTRPNPAIPSDSYELERDVLHRRH